MEEDFGDALAEAMLEVFRKLGTTVEDSQEVKKDCPLFGLTLEEDTFLKVMESHGFKKAEPRCSCKGRFL